MTKQYIPEPPDKYKGEQAIISSGRVLLNAKSDSILMFSKQAISFSSAGTLNFDSDSKCIIGSPRIFLGLNAKEPLLLGRQTTDLLRSLLESLQKVSDGLAKMRVNIGDVKVDLTEINTPSDDLSKRISILLSQLKNIESKNNFTT